MTSTLQKKPAFATAAEVELATFYVADLLLGIPIHEVEEISRYCLRHARARRAGFGLRRDEPPRRSRDRVGSPRRPRVGQDRAARGRRAT